MSPRHSALRAILLLLPLLGASFVGCHREPVVAESTAAPAPSSAPSTAQPSARQFAPTAAVVTPFGSQSPPLPPISIETKRSAKGRVVAVGDLHGDLDAAIGALKLAKVIDDKERWIGGDTAVVQTGDVLDRGNQERRLLEFLDRLEAKAKEGGGAFYRLNGNHEIMNVAGDFRYVATVGFMDFEDCPRPATIAGIVASSEHQRRARCNRKGNFSPGSYWAEKLSQYPVVLQVDDTVFAHGGLVPAHVDYGLEKMNAEVSAWMRAIAPLPKALQGDDTPYWNRDYGDAVSPEACAALDVVLSRLSAKRLVVGHTVQKTGISFACDGKVARIDVGLSSYYGHRAPTVLEIKGGKMKVLDGAPKH